MRIAITGATGSLGGALVQALVTDPNVDRIVALSRDEVKSGDLAERFSSSVALRCVLGDVRDRHRLEQVFRGCDTVIHAAALKRITQSVYSPGEIIKTNVVGTMNVIDAAAAAGVSRVLVVSSDKAVEAANLYGASKAMAEGYATQSNSYVYPQGTRVACVRYGNVLGSRGSVVGVWRAQLARGEPLTMTDLRMTRFVITLPQAAAFCLEALDDMDGGEIFVPRLPAARVEDIAYAVAAVFHGVQPTDPGFLCPRVFSGLRPGGEKLHEALLSREEPSRTVWLDNGRMVPSREEPSRAVWRDNGRMVILPAHHSWRSDLPRAELLLFLRAPYTSDDPDRWLVPVDLVEMLKDVP